MTGVKKVLRHTVIPLAYAIGIHRSLLKRSGHKRMILCFHGTSQYRFRGYAARHLHTSQFVKILDFVKSEFDVIPAVEMFAWSREAYVPRKHTVCLTFDDGFLNNLTHAVPVLESKKMPATFFIATQSLTEPNETVWPAMVDMAVGGLRAKEALVIDGQTFRKTGASLTCGDLHIYDYIKQQHPDQRQKTLNAIREQSNFQHQHGATDPEFWRLMNTEDIQALAASPVATIGSHAHRHFNLANVPGDVVHEELNKSKSLLEHAVQKEVSALAFPDGSYSRAVKAQALDAGYRDLHALSYFSPEDRDDVNILPRFTVSHTTTWQSNVLRLCSEFKHQGF